MKKIYFPALCIFLFLASVNAQAPKEKKTTVTMNYISAYCGGARPTEEILQELQTPRPLANCWIMFVHENNMAMKGPLAKTNEKGEALLNLKPGKYKIFLASNKMNEAKLPFNKKCKAIYKMAVGEFEYTGSDGSASVKIPCDPCDPNAKKRP